MADFVIRGMEMPENCYQCPSCDKENEKCQVLDDYIFFDRPSWCPLVPLPAWHGRLIDAERFRVILCRLKERLNDDVAIHALSWVIECLDKLDTIVPAEGGGEDG